MDYVAAYAAMRAAPIGRALLRYAMMRRRCLRIVDTMMRARYLRCAIDACHGVYCCLRLPLPGADACLCGRYAFMPATPPC